MSIPEMVVSVGLVTEFIKRAALATFKIVIKGSGAVILSVLVSIGVVFVFAINTATPITFSLIPILIQVAIYANAGYAIVTKKSDK